MNLVQIQERLKDAPMQAVMQYANGTNPMVPPYLALAELKRRESVNKSAQMQQDMAQGQQPSVKEQVEQAAGLAALRQQMQQEGMQNLMSQVSPRTIPENVPQPERQPTSEGISSLPVRDMYNFRGGGIVAFQGGGETGVLSIDEMRAEYQKLLRANRRVEANEMLEKIKTRQKMERLPVTVPVAPMDEAILSAPRQTDMQRAEVPSRAPAAIQPAGIATFALEGDYQSALRDVMAIRDPAERSAALEALQRTQRAAPSPQPTTAPTAPARGIAALPGADEAQKMVLEQMRAKPDLSQAAEEYRKAQGLFGLTQPYGEERMKRAQAMEAARQQELESRGLERLMRVMGGIGARGLQGASPAYLQAVGEERAADAAFRKQMDELMGGVEEKRRAEAVSGMTDAQKRIAEERKSAQEAAGKVYDAQRKREDEAFRIRLEHQLRMMQPNEASILLNVMADLRKRNPDKSEAEIYAMAREAQQGATPELKRQQDYAKQYDIAAKNWADPTVLKEKGLTREQYIERHIREALQLPKRELDIGNVPPIPAGAVRLKGAQ